MNGWENFYVIVGSSAGALIGLQFVVITLVAAMPIVEGQQQAGSAFATPTVVHFAAALLLSAIATAPWHELAGAADIWIFLGLIGIVYEVIVARRMKTQSAYTPVLEDWVFHVLLPLAAYAMLAVSAGILRLAASAYVRSSSALSEILRSSLSPGMFAVGAASLLLLFIGIHNAWDTVTYHIFTRRAGEDKAGARAE